MRVMNVKFVGRIIMTVLFVFICIGAHAGDDPLKYEIEGEGVGAQGIYLVKVTVIQKKSKLDVDVIKKCAVHGVLFKGFSSQTSRTRQKPLAGSMVVEQQHQDYFDVFFQKGGFLHEFCQYGRRESFSGEDGKAVSNFSSGFRCERRPLSRAGISRSY